jgi:hypothetical protein
MIIKELANVIYDTVTIYKAKGDDYEDIYKGSARSIPAHILEMEVRIVGATRKGQIDIQVF